MHVGCRLRLGEPAIRPTGNLTLKIGCAQLPARPVGEARAALDHIIRAIERAAARDVDLLVMPECSYPGYILLRRDPYGAAIPGPAQALARIAAAAKRTAVAVTVGLARPGPSGELRNEAVFIDRRGRELARYAKIHLWNFDRRWFAPGDVAAAFETDFGRLGMMICADGRVPEIARGLASSGAWLILDPTAWVSDGERYDTMRNPQVEFLLSVRAKENGVWIAAADKCGSEMSAVHYVGRSMVVDPSGAVRALGPPSGPALVVAEVTRRRVRFFSCPLSALERRALSVRSVRVPKASGGRRGSAERRLQRLGVYQPASIRKGDWQEARRALAVQTVDAIVNTGWPASVVSRTLRRIPGLGVATISADRMLPPEPARAAALSGTDVLVWVRPPRGVDVRSFARTRALENRIYVIVCASARDPQPACVVAPSGCVIASAIAGTPSGFIAELDIRAARDKTAVPGTDVFADRRARFPGL
ncbi:MAG: hypothetical protein GIW99_06280 [Candidatus Eremiobacteraeota bacterium]|nr:hypothetical protein [Candidatus Eremiobacteraeota bacterium]MBC5827274.1 hypothetical protein [Candidatus Eremiobacteraeota bacterium]